MKKINLIFFVLIFFSLQIQAQHSVPSAANLVQFSGVVVSNDSLKPLPFVNITVKNTFRGTVSDYYGFFSFVAQIRDTLEFSAVGFKKAYYIVPDSLKDNRYSLIQMMGRDTIYLKETVIYPWPTKEQFKEAFLSLNIPDDDLERAKKNLDRSELSSIAAGMPMNGSMNFRNQMQDQQSKLYYSGQLPPNNLLNPIAWMKFIKAWKEGVYKRKDKNVEKNSYEFPKE